MKFKESRNLLLLAILIIFFLQLIGLGFLFFCPVKIASAQIKETLTGENVKFTPQVDIPGSSTFRRDNPITFNKDNRGLLLAQYIEAWYKFAVAAVGILAVVMIMGGGLIWLTAGGKANQVSTAKDWITGAVVGLILALMSYTLLDILNPSLVTFQSLKIDDVAFVDSGVCCFPKNGTKASSSKGVKDDSCVFKDAEGEVIETGTRCNILQACRLKTSVDETAYTDPASGIKGQYYCVNVEDGVTECGDASACAEGWFCVNGICWNGSVGDSCDMNVLSCGSGYYCSHKVLGNYPNLSRRYGEATCYDGVEGDTCNEDKIGECNEPMVCKGLLLGGGECQYDRSTGNCIHCNQPCESDSDCCGECGDCEGVLEGGGWQATCVVPN